MSPCDRRLDGFRRSRSTHRATARLDAGRTPPASSDPSTVASRRIGIAGRHDCARQPQARRDLGPVDGGARARAARWPPCRALSGDLGCRFPPQVMLELELTAYGDGAFDQAPYRHRTSRHGGLGPSSRSRAAACSARSIISIASRKGVRRRSAAPRTAGATSTRPIRPTSATSSRPTIALVAFLSWAAARSAAGPAARPAASRITASRSTAGTGPRLPA